MRKKKIAIITNIAPLYRKALWKRLLQQHRFEYLIAYGDADTISGIEQIPLSDLNIFSELHQIKKVKNVWFKNKALIWQSSILGIVLEEDCSTIIFLGDSYCFSTWIMSLVCRLRGIHVVFWGHGIYGNESKIKLFFRKTFYRLAHKHLLYGRRAKKLMVEHGFDEKSLYVVFNSLNYDQHKLLMKEYDGLSKQDVYPFFKNPNLPVLIFIGRLTFSKKLDLLLHAVNVINNEKIKVNLLLIGDGPVRVNLEKIGKKGLAYGWLHFTGSCYSEKINGRYLFFADLCVSPGNIGLTAVHSLSFGTPICTHENFNNQGPEVEAIIRDHNGFFFKENDLDDLISGIKEWFVKNSDREKVRRQCTEIVDMYYNPDYQLTVFNRVVENKNPEI